LKDGGQCCGFGKGVDTNFLVYKSLAPEGYHRARFSASITFVDSIFYYSIFDIGGIELLLPLRAIRYH
jgi:hypothetical protein